jgi:hypothetical protein
VTTTCPKCQLEYDDTYRWTFCPHEQFEMRTRVFHDGKDKGIATSLEELHEMTDGEL